MANIYIQEAWFNFTERRYLGESDVYETSFSLEEREELKKSLENTYGEYIGDITDENDDRVIGWTFDKETPYEDSEETFTLHTDITLHSQPPTKTITYPYL